MRMRAKTGERRKRENTQMHDAAISHIAIFHLNICAISAARARAVVGTHRATPAQGMQMHFSQVHLCMPSRAGVGWAYTRTARCAPACAGVSIATH